MTIGLSAIGRRIAIVFIACVVAGCQPTPVVSPALPTDEATLASSPDDPVAAWGRVGAPAFFDPIRGTGISAVTVLGTRLVAVGNAADEGAAWVRDPDGAWLRSTDEDLRTGRLADVAATPAVLVAGGIDRDGIGFFAMSADGLDWTVVPAPDVRNLPASVATDGRGFMAVYDQDGGTAGLLRSSDGVTWQPAGSLQLTESAIRYSIGGWLVTGTRDGNAALQLSVDGELWASVAPPDDATRVGDIVRWAGSFVAVGAARSGAGLMSAAVWTSRDLARWTPVAGLPDAVAADRDAWINRITPRTLGLIAAGIAADGRPGVWTSVDGMVWDIVRSPSLDLEAGRADITGVAAVDGTTVVVGTAPLDDPSSRFVAAAWETPSPAQTIPARWIPDLPACPIAQPTVSDVAALSPELRLACFGDRQLTLSGWIQGSDCGEQHPGEPSWLASDCGLVLTPLPNPPQAVVFVTVHTPPGMISDGMFDLVSTGAAHVILTGAFDHPAAADCDRRSVSRCRQHFVVTGVRPAG